MYAGFFGFRELPFNNTPDPRFFYPTPDHEEALASLIYAVKERKGFVLLTGEVGTGKTLVSRMMLRHFGTQISSATINHAVPSVVDLMESICTEFELPAPHDTSPSQLVRTLHDFLLAQFSQNIPVALVLDEAQNLPGEGFEQLRMIGNLESDDAKLLQIAIVGQPELQRMFLSPALRQIRQRIFRSFHLPALSREATEGYIRHRISVVTDAGAEVFNADAMNAIFRFSRGLPRVINTICDNALLSAYSADRRVIDAAFLESVISQMMIFGGPAEGGEEPPKPATEQTGPLPPALPLHRAGTRGNTGRSGSDQSPRQRAAEVLADRIAQMSSRLAEMESRLAGLSLESRTADRPAAASRQVDVLPMVRGELDKVGNALRAQVQGVADRLAALERQLCAAPDELAEARGVEARLKPLVQQARAEVDRAEHALQDLEHRDRQLRTLAAAVKDIIRDLRKLLDQAEETSARSGRAEQSARSICDRLSAQSESSRRLADELTHILDRLVSHGAGTRPPAALAVHKNAPGDAVLTPGPRGITHHIRPHGVQQMLDNARESLSELRDLARKGPATPPDRNGKHRQPATTRLARQVEGLLEMIEPHEVPPLPETASPTS